MLNITSIFLFLFVLSILNVFRISFIFLRALLQTSPERLKLSGRDLLIFYLTLSYIITYIIDYLTQIRKLENYLVFDVAFPMTWKILKKHIIEDKFVNNGTSNDLLNLSFVSEYDEKNINIIQDNILNIINYNLEREEKERLLEMKINELKTIFDKESLDNLKNFKFDINKKISLNDVKSRPSTEVIELPSIIAEEG